MATRRASSLVTALVVAAVAVLAAWWSSRDEAARPTAPTSGAPVEEPRPAPPAPRPPPPSVERPPPTPAPALALATIADPDERAAVVAIAAAIDRGGPFAYRKDGAVFENREGRLPRQPRGYWREYTVPTPGEDDRGARRLIGGARHELYYTRDHYRSFVAVRGPP